jgi:hypothetical protein
VAQLLELNFVRIELVTEVPIALAAALEML